MSKRVGIVGAGAIAKHLANRLTVMGVDVVFMFGRNSQKIFENFLDDVNLDAVFIAISTLDKGEAARDYILKCAERDIQVITCEKGSLGYHSDVVHLSKIGKLGYSATVGGGTRMLKYLRGRRQIKGTVEIHAVLNGTLNFVFDEMRGNGRSLGEACEEASRLGYAEPGATDPLSLINGELKDVLMKTCVLFNTSLSDKVIITPDGLGSFEQTAEDLEIMSETGGDLRLVISFSNHRTMKEYSCVGNSFSLNSADGWSITGAFRDIPKSSQAFSWLPVGVGNAIHLIEGDLGHGGKYTLLGPGAGHEPTTSAMIADFEECSI